MLLVKLKIINLKAEQNQQNIVNEQSELNFKMFGWIKVYFLEMLLHV